MSNPAIQNFLGFRAAIRHAERIGKPRSNVSVQFPLHPRLADWVRVAERESGETATNLINVAVGAALLATTAREHGLMPIVRADTNNKSPYAIELPPPDHHLLSPHDVVEVSVALTPANSARLQYISARNKLPSERAIPYGTLIMSQTSGSPEPAPPDALAVDLPDMGDIEGATFQSQPPAQSSIVLTLPRASRLEI